MKTYTALKTNIYENTTPVYRFENKYIATKTQVHEMEKIISKLAVEDANSKDSSGYIVKSLYFDTPYFNSFYDTEEGETHRFKIRLRNYGDDNFFKIEIKIKHEISSYKHVVTLTREEALNIAQGNYDCLKNHDSYEAMFIYSKLVTNGFRPVNTVIYHRKAYFLPGDNFRITFDTNIKSYLNKDIIFHSMDISALESFDSNVIEVKYNSFCPLWVSKLLTNNNLIISANSKYTQSIYNLY